MHSKPTIRSVGADEWRRVGELGELLVRRHHGFDRSRFIPPSALRAEDYVARVREELIGGNATVDVALVNDRIVGYVFAGIEPESWKELRPQAGYIHDLVVDEAHRHAGIGRALVTAALDWFAARGVHRVMLWTAPWNEDARRLFDRLGFRHTMIEMTLDLA